MRSRRLVQNGMTTSDTQDQPTLAASLEREVVGDGIGDEQAGEAPIGASISVFQKAVARAGRLAILREREGGLVAALRRPLAER